MVYGGKTHVLPPCFVLPPSLVNLFIVLSNHLHGEWLVVVGVVIVFGSGVAGLSVPFPHAHSTHNLPFTPLHPGQFTFTATSVEAHAEQWSVMLTRRAVVCSFSPNFGWSVCFFWGGSVHIPHAEVCAIILMHSCT